MKKRLAALFLCLLMLAALLPAAVADGEPEESAQPEAVSDAPAEETAGLDPDEEERASNIIVINETNFPDARFRSWIVANVPGVTVDANGVCSITRENAKKLPTMDVSGLAITSLTGVSKFPNLVSLECQENKLKDLDVSSLKQLEVLTCQSNKLEKIKLGSTKNLVTLNCSGNAPLKSLSLAYNTALVNLSAAGCALTSIDVSPCTALANLTLSRNQLKKLDLSKNTKLEFFDGSNNSLEKLDVTKNTALWALHLDNNELTELNVSGNTDLTELSVQGNKLDTLDVSALTALDSLCADSNALTALDVTKNAKLTVLTCGRNALSTLDVSQNPDLIRLDAGGNLLTSVDLAANAKLNVLALNDNRITAIDLSANTALTRLNLAANRLGALNLNVNSKLTELDCSRNALRTLNLGANPLLVTLNCTGNQLTELELGALANLTRADCGGQELLAPNGILLSGDSYLFNMSAVLSAFDRVEVVDYPFDRITGSVTLPGYISSFDYLYDTGKGQMRVKLLMPYSGTATFEFAEGAVQYRGTTPYVLYDGKEHKPAFSLRNENGEIIDPSLYTYTYSNNIDAGTAYVNVTFRNTTNTATGWFKIYLPATEWTAVENVQNGIKVRWKRVEGAGGYVIYRRAWSSTTNGWTEFKRWNNTTGTEWIDTNVYACSRYQYGIKAYSTDPMDNYNLGVVGPLKTTVRITTRVLTEIKPGTGKLTIKWEGSKYFTGYEVQFARDEAFTKGVKAFKIKKPTTYHTTITGLKERTTYYVRIRSYHMFEDVMYFGGWSNVLSAKTK